MANEKAAVESFLVRSASTRLISYRSVHRLRGLTGWTAVAGSVNDQSGDLASCGT